MTPFQQLQVWFRRASILERAGTVVAVLVTVGLVAWLVIPVHHGNTANVQPADAGTNPTGNQAGTAIPSGNDASGGATHCPPTVDQGTTGSQIDVAVTIINLPGGSNQAVGVPSAAQQHTDWQIVSNAINASGGVACRQLALHYYDVNPADSNDAQQQCLAIADSHPFLAIDTGSLVSIGASDCIPAQQIPLVGISLSQDQLSKYYPYYISTGDTAEHSIHDGVFAWKKLGYLSAAKGFRKLGIVYHTCLATTYSAFRKNLTEVGVPANDVVAYNLGCPTGGNDNPADLQQAVLTFKHAGVTDVTEADMSDFSQFTKVAAGQNWKPDYLLADSSLVAFKPSAATSPNPGNYDGAIDIVNVRYGEQNTPGYKPTGATAHCNSIFAAQKQQAVYVQPAAYGGAICGLLYFAQALIDHAPHLKRNALVSGMHSLGDLDFSYPGGPEDFSAAPAGSAYGRGDWRLVKFVGSCSCWQVPDPPFNPPFK